MNITIHNASTAVIDFIISEGYRAEKDDTGNTIFTRVEGYRGQRTNYNMRLVIRTHIKENPGITGQEITNFCIERGFKPISIKAYLSILGCGNRDGTKYRVEGKGIKEAKYYHI